MSRIPRMHVLSIFIALVAAGPVFGGPLPEGTASCHIFGWSASDNPAGLDIRSEPTADAVVIGKVQPPFVNPSSEIAPVEGWRAEFTIVGYHNDWFLIEDIQQPGAPYGEADPHAAAPFGGRGWVPAEQVMGAYANSQMPNNWLLEAPHVDAEIADPFADPLSIDGTLKALLACSGDWALTESINGTRGWWRGICSNQATNCS